MSNHVNPGNQPASAFPLWPLLATTGAPVRSLTALRAAGADANPYLALAAILAATAPYSDAEQDAREAVEERSERLDPQDHAEIVADVANYTDIAPIVQISEIVGG